MRPSKYLKELHSKIKSRLGRLRFLADKASSFPMPESNRLISYITIETLNTWANFSRAYFLSCTLSPFRESGIRIVLTNQNIHSFHDAIDAAMRRCKYNVWKQGGWRRRDEPPWHRPDTLIRSCDAIGCSNQVEILGAFSIPTKVFDHLSLFRNFFAHRNDYTVTLIKGIAHQYSIPVHQHPSEILCQPAYGRPQMLIFDWIDDINLTVELLC
jgi:hypothetical protein